MKPSIVILVHQNTLERSLKHYAIYYMAEFWKKRGYKVEFLIGVSRFVPADICLVHVDVSLVPREFLEFANQYEIVLNSKISDVRKRTISNNKMLATTHKPQIRNRSGIALVTVYTNQPLRWDV